MAPRQNGLTRWASYRSRHRPRYRRPRSEGADIHVKGKRARVTLPLSGQRHDFPGPCRLSCYVAGEGEPLLLVHGTGLTASAAEMLPLYETLQNGRTVIALDLPGFGASERGDLPYSPQFMVRALHMTGVFVRKLLQLPVRHPLDVVASGSACEYVAQAAVDDERRWGRLAFICPTGLDSPHGRLQVLLRSGGTLLHKLLSAPLWSEAVYDVLSAPGPARLALRRRAGTPFIDEELFALSQASARAEGAYQAVMLHLGGYLNSPDIADVYAALTQPVWMSHGKRGTGSHLRSHPEVAEWTNWRQTTFRTGDLPQFQSPDSFVRILMRFLGDEDPGPITRF